MGKRLPPCSCAGGRRLGLVGGQELENKSVMAQVALFARPVCLSSSPRLPHLSCPRLGTAGAYSAGGGSLF